MIAGTKTHLTQDELRAAMETALTTIAALAEEVYAPLQGGVIDRHNKENYPLQTWQSMEVFLGKHPEPSISITDFFDFLNKRIAPTYTLLGKERPVSEDHQREYRAVVQHLLVALDLRQQFIEYNRSLKQSSTERST